MSMAPYQEQPRSPTTLKRFLEERWLAGIGALAAVIIIPVTACFGLAQLVVGREPEQPPVTHRTPSETSSPATLGGTATLVCGEVATIRVGLIANTSEAQDLSELAEARRDAAEEVRALESQAADEQERRAVVTLADELDGAAEMVEGDLDEETFDESFGRVDNAYSDFNDEAC